MGEVRKRVVLIWEKGEEDVSKGEPEILTLTSPNTRAPWKVIVSGGEFYEMQQMKPRRPASWFVDQRAQSDGSMYICSRIDPLFVALAALENTCLEKQQPLRMALEGNNRALFHVKNLEEKLQAICTLDDRYGSDMLLVQICKEKTLKWLCAKVRVIARRLCERQEKQNYVKGEGASVATFNFTSAQKPQDSQDQEDGRTDKEKAAMLTDSQVTLLVPQAILLLSEYVSKQWVNKLEGHFHEELEALRQEQQAQQENSSKKGEGLLRDTSRLGMPEEKPAKQKGPDLSVALKRLAKVDTKGMNAMTSFFAKKKPKQEEQQQQAESSMN